MKLVGKNVLITGAARRIGRQIALTLAKRGANVLAHYRNSKKEALSLKKEIEFFCGHCSIIQADFSSGKTGKNVENFLKKAYKIFPRIDILVNNASVFYSTRVGKISEKDWDEILTANLKAPFFLSQAVGRKMYQQKSGKIINLVDWMGDKPSEKFLPYSISKAGLIAATKGFAKAFAPHVQVTGIAPGPILPAESNTPAEQAKAAEKTLLKRYGSPNDIAETVRFLIEGTDFITGSVISVEGGALLV